jgi:hypothetical protein
MRAAALTLRDCRQVKFPLSTAHSRATIRLMTRIFALLLLFLSILPSQAQQYDYLHTEYVVCSGGPALRKFEDLRVPADRHDKYWGNFTKASIMRMRQLRAQHGSALNLTWLIYRPAYVARAAEDARSSTVQYKCDFGEISMEAAKLSAKVIWFSSTPEFCSFMNSHTRLKLSGFDYFGHSNKYCFLFDYSAEIVGASSCYLHVKGLHQLRRGIFAPYAHVQSYGCNMADGADSMYLAWKKATGHPMIAATGKTDFTAIIDNVTLPTVIAGRWAQ